MDNRDKWKDVIDQDLVEDIDDEEMVRLLEEGKREILEREVRERQENKPPKSPFPKWIIFLIALMMTIQIVGLLPQTFSIPAIDFLKTSAKLSLQDDIKAYKQSVVVIETGSSKGTGFSINEDGSILTNYHVVDGHDEVTVIFRDDGIYVGDVVEAYPEIDLAVLQLRDVETDVPYLILDENPQFDERRHIYFIGNPLKFTWIANEGEVMTPIHVESKELPVMMLDAPVYRGNSGSPVISDDGKVIGVIYATMDHETYGRTGLFIPIDYFYAIRKEANTIQ